MNMFAIKINFFISIILSIFIYWLAPKVEIDPQIITTKSNVIKYSINAERILWDGAERKFMNKLFGPESITHDPISGDIFTGTADGIIWKIDKTLSRAEPVMRIGEDHLDCGMEHVEHICGRVLGIKYISDGKLIVVDAYKGIFAIYLHKKIKQILVKPDQNMLTRSLKFFNAVDISENGVIYFTVSSMKWSPSNSFYSVLEGDSTGRVYSYNLINRKLSVIAANLSFPNGLALAQNESTLIVSEMLKMRLLKINLLSTDNNCDIFVDNLPGLPDNVKKDRFDNYYVAMLTEYPKTLSFLHKHPLITYSIAWLIPKWLLTRFSFFESEVYKIDNEGQIISIINGNKNSIKDVTEAYQIEDKILLGNLNQPHLDVIYLKL